MNVHILNYGRKLAVKLDGYNPLSTGLAVKANEPKSLKLTAKQFASSQPHRAQQCHSGAVCLTYKHPLKQTLIALCVVQPYIPFSCKSREKQEERFTQNIIGSIDRWSVWGSYVRWTAGTATMEARHWRKTGIYICRWDWMGGIALERRETDIRHEAAFK